MQPLLVLLLLSFFITGSDVFWGNLDSPTLPGIDAPIAADSVVGEDMGDGADPNTDVPMGPVTCAPGEWTAHQGFCRLCNPFGDGWAQTTSKINDENPCTDDVCDPGLAVVHWSNNAPCDDGSSCTEDSCNPETGACEHVGPTSTPAALVKVLQALKAQGYEFLTVEQILLYGQPVYPDGALAKLCDSYYQ